MSNKKNILYLGNNLTQKSKYHTAYTTLKTNLRKEGYIVFTASSKKNQILRLLDMIFTTIKFLRKVDYILIDTFSTNAFYYAYICSQIARFTNTKYIPILHGGNLPNRLKRSKKMCNHIFKNAYINISPSNYLYNEFKNWNYKVNLIPNSVHIDEFKFKERVNIKPNILYVRAFAKIYNPILAIKVFKIVKDKFPEAKLCMVGPDKDGTLLDVKNKVKEYKLEKSVTFTGVLPKEEWHQLSAKYDIFINTTNVDNTPVSLIETMALGLPIVSTNVGGVPFLMEHNIDCLLVDPNEEELMSKAIINLLENNNKAFLFSKKGRVKAESMDWSVIKHRWKKILV